MLIAATRHLTSEEHSMDLKVDPTKLAALAADNADSAARIAESLDAFASSAQELRDQWKGEAQTAFSRRSSAHDAQWRMHAATLRSLAARLAQLAEEYDRADAQGARTILGLSSH